MGLQIGDTIDDKYRIVKLLGEGGMGAVYEGENVRIHRRVAIKILHSNVASSEDAVQRFEREAQAAGRIGSEHIVEVLDLGDLPGGDRYMVMEYLDGQSLSDRITGAGRLSPQITASIIIDMLTGLKAAHEAGIIHRDLKPDNVFLLTNKNGKKDFVKIVDFGISKFSSLGGEFSMTRTGAVMGTPYYLSPEQAKGERELDARADLYAVGVILYEAAAGRVPFDGETFNELLFKIVLEPSPPLSTYVPDIDTHFAAIVEKAMARNPALRFQTAEEMKQALAGWLEGQPAAPELLASANAAIAARSEMKSQTAFDGNAGTVMQTNGAWANTNASAAASQDSKKKIIAAAAAAVILLGGFGIYAMKSSEADAQTAAALAEEERTVAEEEKRREQDLARLEAEKAKAEAERARADAARSEAEKATAEAQLSAAAQARIRIEEEKKRKEEEAKRTAPAVAPRPRPQSGPRPSPSPQPSTSGRRIRTEL
jgi:serine/threonine-protein kinase